jgi:hypothetical protein
MKLSSYRRLYDQDFDPEYKKLIEQLGIIINTSFEELYDALNNKLTFTENFNVTIIDVNITVDSSGNPKNNTQFKLRSGQTTFDGIFAIGAKGTKDPSVIPSGGIFINAIKDNNNIIIKNIKGLQADTPYTVKVVALG